MSLRPTPPPRKGAIGPDGLTPKQRGILRLIYEDARDRGYQPSLGEIAEVMGLGSQTAVYGHLRALARKGWIRAPRPHSSVRAVELLSRPDGSPFTGFAEKPREDRA